MRDDRCRGRADDEGFPSFTIPGKEEWVWVQRWNVLAGNKPGCHPTGESVYATFLCEPGWQLRRNCEINEEAESSARLGG